MASLAKVRQNAGRRTLRTAVRDAVRPRSQEVSFEDTHSLCSWRAAFTPTPFSCDTVVTWLLELNISNSITPVALPGQFGQQVALLVVDASAPSDRSVHPKFAKLLYFPAVLLFACFAVGTGLAQTQSYTESVIYAFCDEGANCSDGILPFGIIQGSDGNFYGTTAGGGTGNPNNCNSPGVQEACGTVFRITPSGTLSTLYSFCTRGGANCTDGFAPLGNLIEGSDGNFYGTTSAGGSGSVATCGLGGCGTIFKITPSGSLTTTYNFCVGGGICPDGSAPVVNLTVGSDGNFYGMTTYGGAFGGGTLFKVTPSGRLTTLYSFCSRSTGSTSCADGANPVIGLVLGTDGAFYGTTLNGGGHFGTIFKVTSSGSLTTLFSFCSPDCSTGFDTRALIEGSDGDFYGVAVAGNVEENSAVTAGTMFKITPSGAFSVFYGFCNLAECADGYAPDVVIQGSDGNFYGLTEGGYPTESIGPGGAGTAFKITPSGRLMTLYDFCSQGSANCTDGAYPTTLVQASDGLFYGTTLYGGVNSAGVVFKLTPTPNSSPAISPDGVVSASAYGKFATIAPGSQIEIYGSNLAKDTRGWDSADFNGVNAPTSLEGTSVTIDGKNAFVDYISPDQVNVVVPSDVPTGLQPLMVKTDAGVSPTLNVIVNALEPGLLAPPSFNLKGTQFVVAFLTDGAYALQSGAIAGLNSRPAQPGDIITLYGVGFGPVVPNIPAGQLVKQINTLASSFQLSIGGMPANVDYSGLAPNYTGLYQFNVTVPEVAPGNVPLTFKVGSVTGSQTLSLAVGH